MKNGSSWIVGDKKLISTKKSTMCYLLQEWCNLKDVCISLKKTTHKQPEDVFQFSSMQTKYIRKKKKSVRYINRSPSDHYLMCKAATWPSRQPRFILVNAANFHSRIPWHMIQVCVGDLAIAIKTSHKCLWVTASVQHCTTMHQRVCADVFGHQRWAGIPLTCSSVRVRWRQPSVRTAFSSISACARIFILHSCVCLLASQAIVAGSRHSRTAAQSGVCALPFKKKISSLSPGWDYFCTGPSLHICCSHT